MTLTYELDQNLYINITNRCPNACEFCIRTEGDSIGGNDSLWLDREPDVKEVCDDIDKRELSKYDEVVFCGFGEPTCRLEALLEIAKYIRKKSDIKIRINTNGLSDLINNRPTAKEMAGVIDSVSISLNASNAKSYDDVCHSEFGLDAFDAMLDFTKSAVGVIPEVIMSVVDTIGKEEIEKCRKICEGTGAKFRIREFIG